MNGNKAFWAQIGVYVLLTTAGVTYLNTVLAQVEKSVVSEIKFIKDENIRQWSLLRNHDRSIAAGEAFRSWVGKNKE